MKKLNNTGMTLIEAVVALLILALFIVPIAGIYAHGLKVDRIALTRTLATYEAQMRIEEVYGLSYNDLKEKCIEYVYPSDSEMAGFSYIFITPKPIDAVLGLYEVKVTVKNSQWGDVELLILA